MLFMLSLSEVKGRVYGAFEGAGPHALDVLLDDVLVGELAHEFIDGRDNETEHDDAADGIGEDDPATDVSCWV